MSNCSNYWCFHNRILLEQKEVTFEAMPTFDKRLKTSSYKLKVVHQVMGCHISERSEDCSKSCMPVAMNLGAKTTSACFISLDQRSIHLFICSQKDKKGCVLAFELIRATLCVTSVRIRGPFSWPPRAAPLGGFPVVIGSYHFRGISQANRMGNILLAVPTLLVLLRPSISAVPAGRMREALVASSIKVVKI